MRVQVRHKPTISSAVYWDDSDEARRDLEALGFLDVVGEFRYARPGQLILDDGRTALLGDWIVQGAQEFFALAPSLLTDRFWIERPPNERG